MRRILLVITSFVLFIGLAVPVGAASRSELDAAVSGAAAYILRTVQSPGVGTVGGEWAVIGLARSGHSTPDSFFRNYRREVERLVREQRGILDERRFTEYSRVILAMTAVGLDPKNVVGFDLTRRLGDFDRTLRQGINGAVFALLALDSFDYPVPVYRNAETQATREMYVAEILRRQTPDGGWNMTAGTNGAAVGGSERGDVDITAMALQALAKYQDDEAVRAAANRALRFLSRSQDEHGGFSSGFSRGAPTVESAAQVLIALTELGVDLEDPRFVKNGNTIIDNIVSFQNADGGFSHTLGDGESDLMPTEQALLGLVAAQRAADGQNSLFRMSDAR
ncbi:MAG: terpene cyclase/mutase family protein [Defluviitaleaceae bacterium]|nr:terpene cyclase/mutase family protein [Defluviitaleaceae bacterium]